jgi:uncharacterized protein YfkK (UPF0435 family)
MSVYLYGLGELIENSEQLKHISLIVPIIKSAHNHPNQTDDYSMVTRDILTSKNIKQKTTNELITMWQTQREQYSEQELRIIANELNIRISNTTK